MAALLPAAIGFGLFVSMLVLTARSGKYVFPLYRDICIVSIALCGVVALFASTVTATVYAILPFVFGALAFLVASFNRSPVSGALVASVGLVVRQMLGDAPLSDIVANPAAFVVTTSVLQVVACGAFGTAAAQLCAEKKPLLAHTLLSASLLVGAVTVLPLPRALGATAASYAAALALRRPAIVSTPLFTLAGLALSAWAALRTDAPVPPRVGATLAAAAALLWARTRNAPPLFATPSLSAHADRTAGLAIALQQLVVAGLATQIPAAAAEAEAVLATLAALGVGAAVAAALASLLLSMDAVWEPVTSVQWRLMTLDNALLTAFVAVPVGVVAAHHVDFGEVAAAAQLAVALATERAGASAALQRAPAHCLLALTGGVACVLATLAVEALLDSTPAWAPFLGRVHTHGQQEQVVARRGAVAVVVTDALRLGADGLAAVTDALASADAPATLCIAADCVGPEQAAGSAAVRAAVSAGHEVALQMTRPDNVVDALVVLADHGSAVEVQRAVAVLAAAAPDAPPVTLVAPAAGSLSARHMLAVAHPMNRLHSLLWTAFPQAELRAQTKPVTVAAANALVGSRLCGVGGEVIAFDGADPQTPDLIRNVLAHLGEAHGRRTFVPAGEVCTVDVMEVNMYE